MRKKTTALLVVAAVLVVAGSLLFRGGSAPNARNQQTAETRDPFSGVGAGDIVRISLTRQQYDHGAFRPETSVLEKSREGTWQMSAPVVYPVNLAMVHEILGTLQKLKPRPLSDSHKGDEPNLWGIRPPAGITVALVSASQGELRFIVGRTRGETTFLGVPDSPEVFAAAGRIRKVFDRGPSDLRLRQISRFDTGAIERMTFHNRGAPFVLVRDGDAGAVRYRPEGEAIENFDEPKAIHRAAALSRLRAKAFFDAPHQFSADDLRVTLDVRIGGATAPVTLTFGCIDPESGLHFAASSLSDQVFLLSPHMKSLFTATPEAFALSDEQVARRQALQAELSRRGHIHGAHGVLNGKTGNGSEHDDLGTDAHFEDHVE